MSEYQYYEFQTIDRVLSEKEMEVLRTYSTRAIITSRKFVNTYNWGDFKGDRRQWLQKYFDAFIYSANWGTYELMFRFPKTWVNHSKIKKYLKGDSHSVWSTSQFVIISLSSQNEEGDSYDYDGSHWMPALQSLREDIIRDDDRFFYLAWLASLQNDELSEGNLEPPVPPGLNELSASLKSLAAFLRLDKKLISIAAHNSPPLKERDRKKDYYRWLKGLSEAQKMKWLLNFSTSTKTRYLQIGLWKQYEETLTQKKPTASKSRTVKELKGLWLPK